ncbi:polynucleotide adenylyltransferase [Coemansia sp. RSA 989]|nr:polynucleotide adenylyltransferase [Coemansia sp. RSA 1086]KAJ1751780.1 polynucleotide adenylyltransferase [Coemansia sp. RSA 1821]KAJ1867248.1 polynucleotide adenylyltransferase [Coemansia sp. RSA 989]KAJ1876019.1 polynucleotide adenylyltransferase [Coemansia sp. RSA 990]KAJ2674078.1 polynucleotide adenylyltransferase [Coemansia sp. RSA 1085]
MSKPKYLGVTHPIDLNPSNEDEESLANDLLETLKQEGQFESEEERKKREMVLGKIDKLVKEMVYRVSLKHKLPESLARECGGKIFTFGSYRLGAHGAGADIDTLCVVPSHVKRENFFEVMTQLLQERSEVTELTAVTEAYVPVIKMQFSGIDIDLTVGILQQPTIPEDLDLLDNNILRSIDEVSVRSVNGSRVTDEILRLVPNIPTFRLALRCIKLWAKRRAIYSNPVGFFGGVAWAMAVARICQLYPNKCASNIVTRFFHVFSRWKWTMPIMLKNPEDGPGQFRVWNPQVYPSDRAHKMPIITPAYPSMCATHNVSQSTKQIIEMEIKRGLGIVDKIMKREASWSELFEKDVFFRRYKFYIQVNVSAINEDEYHKLHGFVDSRLRHFLAGLEDTGQFVLVHPYIKSYDHEFTYKTPEEMQRIYAGFHPAKQSSSSETATPAPDENNKESPKTTAVENAPVQDNAESTTPADGNSEGKIYTSAFYLGLPLIKRDRNASGRRRMDLSLPTQEFIKLVKGSDVWKNDEEMAISIRFLLQEQLPDEVFGGQPRERLRFSSSKKKPKKRSSKSEDKKSETDEKAAAKKAKIAEAVVPSTSGFVESTGSKQSANETNGQSNGSSNNSLKPAVDVSIPAPVPPAPRSGGIRLKLLGSQ